MTNRELNQFILHYIEQDRTKSAIMLNGDWGTGKSHYLRTNLIPFLADSENNAHLCVVLSLYGITDLASISKMLYFEIKNAKVHKWAKNRKLTEKVPDFLKKRIPEGLKRKGKELAYLGEGFGITIVRGLLSSKGFDVTASKNAFSKLFQSIDLSGKLIVFEDIERSSVDLLDFLGYINSLVEQDGVKVLLVANENELIQYEPIKEADSDKKAATEFFHRVTNNEKREYTTKTKAYLASKEKTISDTLLFEGDIATAITEIIESYNDETMNRFANKADVDEIVQIMDATRCFNLRSFLFACQKVYDIFHLLPRENEYETDFLKTVFMGIVSFSLRSKTGERLKWEKGDTLSFELGNAQYPLFRFCYNYIVQQQFNSDIVNQAQEELKDYRRYDNKKSNNDQDLIILADWHLNSDVDVRNAVSRITERLRNPDDIAFQTYGRLAYHLIKVSHVLQYDVSQAKDLLVKNLYNRKDRVHEDYLFSPLIDDEDKTVLTEYQELKARMIDSLHAKNEPVFGFTYRPEDIPDFYAKAAHKDGSIYADGVFSSSLDMDRVFNMLKECTASQLHDFRCAFINVYRAGNVNDFLSHDRPAVEELLNKLKELQEYDGFDHIQKTQISYFISNLEDVLKRL